MCLESGKTRRLLTVGNALNVFKKMQESGKPSDSSVCCLEQEFSQFPDNFPSDHPIRDVYIRNINIIRKNQENLSWIRKYLVYLVFLNHLQFRTSKSDKFDSIHDICWFVKSNERQFLRLQNQEISFKNIMKIQNEMF